MATIYARLSNQYRFKYYILFLASFYKINEEDQRSDKTESINNLKISHKLKETDLKNIDVKSQLEHQIQLQEAKESGGIFHEINSMKINFFKSGELNGSNYVKIPLRSSALISFKNDDKNCFLWSILAKLHPCKYNHPNRVSNYKYFSNELNIEGFDFTNGFKCSVVQKFEKRNSLSINIFELNLYQDQNKWKHILILIEISKKEWNRNVDLLINENH